MQSRKTISDRLTGEFALASHCLRWARVRNVRLSVCMVDVLLVSLYYRVCLISIGSCNTHSNSIPVVMRKRANICNMNLRVAAKLICKYNYELTQRFYHKVNDIAFVYSIYALHNYCDLSEPLSSRHETVTWKFCDELWVTCIGWMYKCII